jgi:hypothetical protein
MERQIGFWQALWGVVRPDILAQYRDTAITLNLLLIIAMVQLGFFGLALIHTDRELLGVLEFLHKWATVVVFGVFLYTIVARSIAVAITAHKRAEESDT